MATKLRVGYVPEHFSTPLAFAHQHFGLDSIAELIAEPLGTGALTSRLKAKDQESLDVAIGLTEGLVSDLGKTKAAGNEAGYGLVGTYVQSPLCWAIVTGAQRAGIDSVDDLKGRRVGVSRIGSGSYVMSSVLADQRGWLDTGSGLAAFEPVVAGNFAALRESVQDSGKNPSDFFMWEHFTTRKYWENGELKRIGEIYTPWPSWVVAARDSAQPQMKEVMGRINEGVRMFKERPEEAVKHITSTMHYSELDAREWLEGVRFPDDVRGVEHGMVDSTVGILRKAGLFSGEPGGAEHMVTYQRQ